MMMKEKKTKAFYLREVALTNIKCFGPKQTLSFSRSNKLCMWTIILGDNGTGKSTILKSIALALSQGKDDLNKLNLQEFARNEKSTGQIDFELMHSTKKESKQQNLDISKSSGLKITGPDLSSFDIPVFGYGSHRKLGDKGLSSDLPPFQLLSLFDESVSLINAEDWMLRADYEKVKSNDGTTAQLDKVKSILLTILGDEVSDIEIKKRGFGFGVYFKTRYGWVNMRNLSTGYKSVVTWMVDLSNWLIHYYPNSNDPLLEKAIVLVDEIDLHLHVSLQRNLVHFLRTTFPNIQFIVSAHSPLIVQGSGEENIIILEKNDDHVLIKNNPVNVKNWRVDQILTSDLFGLESARSQETELKLKRRYELMTKDSLDKSEQKEMKQLNKFANDVPVNENKDLDEASKIIMDAAEVLKRLKK